MAAATEIVVENDVASAVGASAEEIGGGVGVVIATHTAEVAVGAEHSSGVFEVESEGEFRPSDCVVESAAQEGCTTVGYGEVFVEEEEIVAEVEIRFSRGGRGEASAAQVINDGLRHGFDVETCEEHTPAEVDFLHVCEEFGVEAAKTVVEVGANHKRSASSPKNGHGRVVLAVVGFDG